MQRVFDIWRWFYFRRSMQYLTINLFENIIHNGRETGVIKKSGLTYRWDQKCDSQHCLGMFVTAVMGSCSSFRWRWVAAP
jgi:hypothetical protein